MENMRILISLNPTEYEAIILLAKKEFRHPREQIRYIIRSFLEQRGFIEKIIHNQNIEKFKELENLNKGGIK